MTCRREQHAVVLLLLLAPAAYTQTFPTTSDRASLGFVPLPADTPLEQRREAAPLASFRPESGPAARPRSAFGVLGKNEAALRHIATLSEQEKERVWKEISTDVGPVESILLRAARLVAGVEGAWAVEQSLTCHSWDLKCGASTLQDFGNTDWAYLASIVALEYSEVDFVRDHYAFAVRLSAGGYQVFDDLNRALKPLLKDLHTILDGSEVDAAPAERLRRLQATIARHYPNIANTIRRISSRTNWDTLGDNTNDVETVGEGLRLRQLALQDTMSLRDWHWLREAEGRWNRALKLDDQRRRAELAARQRAAREVQQKREREKREAAERAAQRAEARNALALEHEMRRGSKRNEPSVSAPKKTTDTYSIHGEIRLKVPDRPKEPPKEKEKD